MRGFRQIIGSILRLPENSGADYIEIQRDGTAIFNGAAHLPYGSMYADNIAETITVSATDTYYPLTAGLSAGGSNGFTFQNASELKCLIAGKYLAHYSASAYTAASNQDLESELMINSTAQENTSNHDISTTANSAVSFSGTGILDLAVDDIVRIAFSNHTSTQNVIVEHTNVTLLMVGG